MYFLGLIKEYYETILSGAISKQERMFFMNKITVSDGFEDNEQRCTNIELWRFIERWNYNHAIKLSISQNQLGYKVLHSICGDTEPMTSREALMFIKGMVYVVQNPA